MEEVKVLGADGKVTSSKPQQEAQKQESVPAAGTATAEPVKPELVIIGLGVRYNLKTGVFSYMMPPDPGMAFILLNRLNKYANGLLEQKLNDSERTALKKPIIHRVNAALNNTKRFIMGK